MKTFLKIFFLLIITSFDVQAQNINIPDVNLKNWLLQSNDLIAIAYSMTSFCDGVYAKIDSNNDGQIQQSEANEIIVLNVGGRGVTNLSGLEHFTNLCYISCGSSNITNVNLIGLTNLKGLFCDNCNISNINLALYPNLVTLTCSYNQITNLNFTNHPDLKIVYCGHNQLTSLDFSQNTLFNELGCEYNNLSSLNIQNGNTQLFGTQTAYNECWGNNPNLTQICADPNEIVALNSFLAGCGINQPITVDSSCALAISSMDPKTISLYPNPSSGIFNLDLSKLPENYTNLEVYDILGKKVHEQKLLTQKDIIINISHLESANYIAKIFNKDKSINIQLIKK